jgi:hypothetical protein
MKLNIFVSGLVIFAFGSSANVFAEGETTTTIGQYGSSNSDHLSFYIHSGGVFGDGVASIYASDKYGINTVSVTPSENGSIKIIGYLKQQVLTLNPSANLDGDAIQVGRQQCIDNPVSCGIELADSNGSTQAGIDQCKDNPTSCGIELADSNGSTQAGIDQCKDNPTSCGIELADSNDSTQAGIDQCKANPTSCGIELADSNGSTQAGIDQCKTDPTSCGITVSDSDTPVSGDCMADYSLAGRLHVPCVSVPDASGGTTVYNIELNQQSGAFTFDLDMGSVKPK